MQAIEDEVGGVTKAAELVGVSQQTWSNWKARGLSREGRLLVWLVTRRNGRSLLRQYVTLERGSGRVAA